MATGSIFPLRGGGEAKMNIFLTRGKTQGLLGHRGNVTEKVKNHSSISISIQSFLQWLSREDWKVIQIGLISLNLELFK